MVSHELFCHPQKFFFFSFIYTKTFVVKHNTNTTNKKIKKIKPNVNGQKEPCLKFHIIYFS